MNKFFGLVFFILCVWFFSITFLFWYFGLSNNLSEAGEMFGGINALFSGLALAGIIYTNWLQSKEIKENQKNIEHTMSATKHSLQGISKN
ncbi:MAG: hypothetical protein AAFZ92_09590 [Pseudomonadota bacterium]